MKIRTAEQLVDGVAAEISWRRKELTDLRDLVQQNSGRKSREDAMTRAAFALLYAHWEGFVKAIAVSYLEFVCMQRCKNSELAPSILAVMVRAKLRAAQSSKKIAAHKDVVDFFLTQMDKADTLPYKSAIRTESNLSSVVFRDILSTLGLDPTPYESKGHLIDNQLLERRNHIAHGSELDVEVDDYINVHEEILGLMNIFRNQVENAAVTREYLSSRAATG